MSGISVHTISYTGAALGAALKVQQRVAENGFDAHDFIHQVSSHLKEQLGGSSSITGGQHVAANAEHGRQDIGAVQNSGRGVTV